MGMGDGDEDEDDIRKKKYGPQMYWYRGSDSMRNREASNMNSSDAFVNMFKQGWEERVLYGLAL